MRTHTAAPAAHDAKWGGGFVKTDNWIDTIVNSAKGLTRNAAF